MNPWSKIFGRKLTTADKLNVINTYVRNISLTADDVGFWLMLVNYDGDGEMRSTGVSVDIVVNEIYERLHYKMSVRAELAEGAKYTP